MRSTMLRRRISSASSRALHWLIGRSESAGTSQASAMIWQICSGVIRAGRPDLGASAKRSATRRQLAGLPALADQRARHWRAVSLSIWRWRAIASVLDPSAASSTMRARSASCWPVVRARTRRSSSLRSACVNTISGGFGPGKTVTSHPMMLQYNILTRPWLIYRHTMALQY